MTAIARARAWVGWLIALGAAAAGAVLLARQRRILQAALEISQEMELSAAGLATRPPAASGIAEIDRLRRAYLGLAHRMAVYQSGLRSYLEQVIRAQEDERQRIARELHDETIQNLLAVQRMLEAQAGGPAPDALPALLEETLRGVRRISRDLRPAVLDDLGLAPALQTLLRAARQEVGAGLDVRFDVLGRPRPLSRAQELALYRIAQEALSNVRRHARAGQVQVQLAYLPGQVRLEVRDDGRGFAPQENLSELAQEGHFGLIGIQERVWAENGTLQIEAAPGEGCRVKVWMPG